MALDNFAYICRAINEEFPFGDRAERLRIAAREKFGTGTGVYAMTDGEETATVLGNSLAILSGIAEDGERVGIAQAIANGGLPEPSLSMKIFEYDALLLTDREKYAPFCLAEVKKNYGAMVDEGSTTVWETAKGEADFDNAGSLCHGWSAIPVYIYHKLGIAEKEEI
jgi:hypothetical protein